MTVIKKTIYFLSLALGVWVCYLILKNGNSVEFVIALSAYALLYKPLCDTCCLVFVYHCKVRDARKHDPFWSGNILWKMYFDK